MLFDNGFDLRNFLAESKNPSLKEVEVEVDDEEISEPYGIEDVDDEEISEPYDDEEVEDENDEEESHKTPSRSIITTDDEGNKEVDYKRVNFLFGLGKNKNDNRVILRKEFAKEVAEAETQSEYEAAYIKAKTKKAFNSFRNSLDYIAGLLGYKSKLSDHLPSDQVDRKRQYALMLADADSITDFQEATNFAIKYGLQNDLINSLEDNQEIQEMDKNQDKMEEMDALINNAEIEDVETQQHGNLEEKEVSEYVKQALKGKDANEVSKIIEKAVAKDSMKLRLEVMQEIRTAYENRIKELSEDTSLVGMINPTKMKMMEKTCKGLVREIEKLQKKYDKSYSGKK